MKYFLRKSLFLLLLVAFATQGQAQKDSTLTQRLGKDFCDEFEKISSKVTKENMNAEIGFLILPLLSRYSDEIKSEWHLDATSPEDIGKVGEKIGQYAAINCPAFQQFIRANFNDIVSQDKKEPAMQKSQIITGNLVKIEGQPFTCVYLRRPNGKTEKLYWMEFFEGADRLVSGSARYVGKNVAFGYKEMEVYNAATKDYNTIKVITLFEDAPPPEQLPTHQ